MQKKKKTAQKIVRVRVVAKCEFPLCTANVYTSKFGLCNKHDDQLQFYLWIKKIDTAIQQQAVKQTQLWRP